jgi:hypothetical protein
LRKSVKKKNEKRCDLALKLPSYGQQPNLGQLNRSKILNPRIKNPVYAQHDEGRSAKLLETEKPDCPNDTRQWYPTTAVLLEIRDPYNDYRSATLSSFAS